MAKADYAEAVFWFRQWYGIFPEELIGGAGLEVDVTGLMDFERRGDLRALSNGDLERIIDYSLLPCGYFDGSLKEIYERVFNLLDSGIPLPEKLKQIGGNFISLWHLGKDNRFPHRCYASGYFECMYLPFIIWAELYDMIINQDIKMIRMVPDRDRINDIINVSRNNLNPRDYSHGKILELFLRRPTIITPTEVSLNIFGDERSIYDLFKEHRFDKATLKALRREARFKFTSFKDYFKTSVLPREAYKLYMKDGSVDNQSKKILPTPEIFYPLSITKLYFVIKGIY